MGYRAKRHSGVIDLAAIGAHAVEDFWEPVRARDGRIVLDPGEFYILASKEKIVIPLDEAAEMAPIAPETAKPPSVKLPSAAAIAQPASPARIIAT